MFKFDEGIFSYRVAGILARNGLVLLQHPPGDPSYAFPGGHVNLGETSQEALIREFKEEIGTEIVPGRLLWIVENFFPWGEKRCHQISLYYEVSLVDERQIPLQGKFLAQDEIFGQQVKLEFCWTPISSLDKLEVYPVEAQDKLLHPADGIEHWVYHQ